MSFQEIEYAGFRAWPATEEIETNGVVLRYANGYTKRANSANVIQQQIGDMAALVSLCEQFYSQKGLPSIFRLPSFCDNSQLDRYLDASGYQQIDRSYVLCRSLNHDATRSRPVNESKAQSDHEESLSITEMNLKSWLESYVRIKESTLEDYRRQLTLLEHIQGRFCPAVLKEDGLEMACGLGVISNGYFGVFSVATKKSQRNKGHGTKLMSGLLDWAVKNGANTAYLQVEADNPAAIHLYSKLGYQQVYEYVYRIKR